MKIRTVLSEAARRQIIAARSRLGQQRVSSGRSSKKMVQRFNAANITLIISPGRTGTASLGHALNQIPRVSSAHEPDPQYRHLLRGASERSALLAVGFMAEVKGPALADRATAGAYIETSHLFSKGFFEASLVLGLRPKLLSVSRPHRAVAESLLKIGAVPGRSRSDQYLLRPNDEPYLRLARPDKLSDYQLCFWYAMEIAHRATLYRDVAQQQGLLWFDIETDALNSLDELVRAVTQLEIADENAARPALAAVVGTHLNRKRPSAQRQDRSAEEAEVKAEIEWHASVHEVFRRVRATQTQLGLPLE